MSRVDLISRMILLLMIVWLLHMADSSTALVCFVIGVGTLVSMQFRPVLQQARRLGMYCLVAGLVGLWVYLSGIYEGFLEMIGPQGLSKNLYSLSLFLSKMHTGYLIHYSFVMVLSFIFSLYSLRHQRLFVHI